MFRPSPSQGDGRAPLKTKEQQDYDEEQCATQSFKQPRFDFICHRHSLVKNKEHQKHCDKDEETNDFKQPLSDPHFDSVAVHFSSFPYKVSNNRNSIFEVSRHEEWRR